MGTGGRERGSNGRVWIDAALLIAGCRRGIGAAGSIGIPTGTAGAFAKPSRDPVSMAMHIHSSFSEGIASMDAHLYQAHRLGVDVIWWTDHDFRKMAHGYRTECRLRRSERARRPLGLRVETQVVGAARVGQPLLRRPHRSTPMRAGGKMQVVAAAQSRCDLGDARPPGPVTELRLLDELQRHHGRTRHLPATAGS